MVDARNWSRLQTHPYLHLQEHDIKSRSQEEHLASVSAREAGVQGFAIEVVAFDGSAKGDTTIRCGVRFPTS